ncbi:putative Ig domain-containing protein, partial [Brucella sp. NBRC 12950]|uniref:putative Ig domain-containing protein n=1 Tax=Brucella sp. NBRC 12950 TaxID=2994518 RepID=UPI0025536BC2
DAPEAVGTIVDQANDDADAITSLDVSDFFKDIDGDTLTYSATGLPKGLTIDPNTGIISGTIDPSASQDGVGGAHSVTITVSDGTSTVDQTFTWTVSNPAPVANDDAVSTDED